MDNKKYVLVCVLNWGLGHATRSTPLIQALYNAGFEPIIASDGIAASYLKNQFPDFIHYELPAYGVHYKAGSFLWGMFRQLFKIAQAVQQEQKVIKQIVAKFDLVGIISDNRLGTRLKGLPSVYVTHQPNIKAGLFSSVASFLHQRYIKQFDYCLIPDVADQSKSLAGALSHGFRLPIPHDYLGILSRFSTNPVKENQEQRYKACIILSGPEPARTEWEAQIIDQATKMQAHQFLLIRGTESTQSLVMPSNIECIDLADERMLLQGIEHSEVVVSRSGYSSLMDYACLGTKALLVPTRGQGEQEYLSEHLEPFFAVQKQLAFDLEKGLLEAIKKPGLQLESTERTPNWRLLFSFFERK